jgi:hypothetical protein
MSLTSQIGSSDSAFKLAQKLVAALAEKFGFSVEDGWNTVSSRTIESVQKRLKREKRRANPAAQVKHARTAFSFFTQKQRPIEKAAHPEATFGQLSRFVSEAWKKLSKTDMQNFKDMEAADKSRYQTEKQAALATVPAPVVAETPAEPSTTEAAPKKARTPKAVKAVATPVETPVAAPVAVAPVEKKVKTPKAAKSAESTPAVVVAEVAPVVAEKKAKTPKATATPVAAATPAVAEPVKAATKAPKAKAVKA